MNRDFRFDVLRTLGLFFILLCHYLTHFNGRCAAEAHDILAGAGNYIFFIISGWLLGIKWRAKECPSYGVEFLFHYYKFKSKNCCKKPFFCIAYHILWCCDAIIYV